MGAALACIYAATYPVRGVVDVDQPLFVRPFAELVHSLTPGLRGDDFGTAFEPIRQSIGLDRLPEPERSRVAARQRIRQDLVLGYWNEMLSTTPAQLQARIDNIAPAIRAPFLAVFGHVLDAHENQHLRRFLPSAQVEQWPERGHLVTSQNRTGSPPSLPRSPASALDPAIRTARPPSPGGAHEHDNPAARAARHGRGTRRTRTARASRPRQNAAGLYAGLGSPRLPCRHSRLRRAGRSWGSSSATRQSPSHDLMPKFLTLPCPRMFMYGKENSTLSYLAKLTAGGVELAEIPHSGHWPMYANPVAMWERIATFIQS